MNKIQGQHLILQLASITDQLGLIGSELHDLHATQDQLALNRVQQKITGTVRHIEDESVYRTNQKGD